MGKKSDKKVKSDRINVLRKKYDAFVEEDKKRKDRNDFILGRLDKMRYSSTAVQPRHTPSSYRDYFAPSYNCHGNIPESVSRHDMQTVQMHQQITRRPSYHNLQLDVPRNYIEENSILKEISKKYILIPKLRANYPNDSIEVLPPSAPVPVSGKPSDFDNGDDWKSKYEILNQLKNKENEEAINNKYTNKDDQFGNNELSRKNNLDRPNDNDHVMQNYIREEIPEKDVSDQLVVENDLKHLEKCKINDQIPSTDVAQVPSALSLNPENTIYYDQKQSDVFDQPLPNDTQDVDENLEYYTQPEQYAIPAEQNVEAISHVDNNQYQENYPAHELQPQQQYPIEYEQFMPETETNPDKVINQEENDYSPIEVINPNELVDQINKDSSAQEANAPAKEYQAEIANTQDFTSEENVEQPVLQDRQGINPENYVTDDGTIVEGNPVPKMLSEDPIDNSGIEEFDAEQREMFYSEQTDENYAYNEHGAAGDAYNAEYAQNQNYPETQEYAYYEGQQEEGSYPLEINEHEETEQLYDQHYEQQYTSNYQQEFEQQAVYMEQDPNQSQFEQPALYDQAQQELEQYTLDQQPAETQEQVEEVLDREDGYIEKRVEDPNAQENIQIAELNVP